MISRVCQKPPQIAVGENNLAHLGEPKVSHTRLTTRLTTNSTHTNSTHTNSLHTHSTHTYSTHTHTTTLLLAHRWALLLLLLLLRRRL